VPQVKQSLERELKFEAPAGFAVPPFPGEPLETRVFTSTYLDTADGRLARAGVTLRRRVENGKSAWQLKVPQLDARLELEAPGGPAGPPEGIEELLIGLTRGRPLGPVARLRTRRRGRRVRENGAPVADVVVDLVTALDANRSIGTFAEIEVELLNGAAGALTRITRVLHRAGARRGDDRPKLLRVVTFEEPELLPLPDESDHLRAMIAAQYHALLAHDPGTRVGANAEDLHRFRVATRRLRAVLRAVKGMVEPAWAETLRAELKWLADGLGPVRDLDVLIAHVKTGRSDLEHDDRSASGELIAKLVAERADARRELLATLRSERYIRLLDALEEAACMPRLVASDISLREIAAGEFRRLRKAAGKLAPDMSDDDLHRLRIKAKRARYAAELAQPVAGQGVERFVKRAKRFQDLAGEHQDAVVAADRIRSLVDKRKPRVAFAAGRLVERQRLRREEARTKLPNAWRKLERAGRRAWA